jgi:hypothetical protein
MSGIARNRIARRAARVLPRLSLAVAAVALAAGPAGALTIKPTFDSSITSLPNAAQIESDFNAVANFYDNALTSPVTVNIGVGWGAVNGSTMGPGALGSSYDNFYGYFDYGQIKGWLKTAAGAAGNQALQTAVKSLPTGAPAGTSNYVIASAQAKALGLIPATQAGEDGWVGFSATQPFDFNPSDGVATKSYDFEGVAAHEIAEVLGRLSGLTGSSPAYRTALDLFRYGAPGQPSFAFKSPAYFSIDGGATNLGDFSYSGGDRSDWLTSTTGLRDVQSASAKKGVAYNVTAADLTALDVLGWGGANLGDTQMWSPAMIAKSFMTVPEPDSWAVLLLGMAGLGAQLRRRRVPALA